LKHLKAYAASAETAEAWAAYRARYVDVSAAAYLAAVGGADALRALPKPAY